MAAPPAARVPVTIVTGFLGSGKSTLLRRILSEKHGMRIAVIENEFADEVGIESLILKQGLGQKVADGFYELSNGCICCSVRDQLVDTIERMMRVREKFDYILVETSGMANPGPVAAAFWSDSGQDTSMLQLDGIITVVDAAHISHALTDSREAGTVREAEQQIACADVILLNKRDLVPDAAFEATHAQLRAMNASARIIAASHCKEPALNELIGIAAFDARRLQLLEGEEEQDSAHAHAGHDLDESCTHCAASSASGSGIVVSAEHKHDSGISTVILRTDAAVDIFRFERWIGRLLWERPADEMDDAEAASASASAPAVAAKAPLVLRGKGVLYGRLISEDSSDEEDGAMVDAEGHASSSGAASGTGSGATICAHIFQSVCEQMEVAAAGTPEDAAKLASHKQHSRVVLIGRHLRREELQAAFEEECVCLGAAAAATS
jgi:G3E family GTPase